MDIRFHTRGGSAPLALAEHARSRLEFRLMDRSDRVVQIAVQLGDTGSERFRHDCYCILRVQLRGLPAATVVDVGADAHATIDRAVERLGRLTEAQLAGAADARRHHISSKVMVA